MALWYCLARLMDKETKQIIKMAGPIAVGIASFVLIHLVDLYWVGYLGEEALAAICVAGGFLFFVFTLTGVVRTSVTTLVSQALGREDEEEISKVTADGLLLALLLGSFVFVVARLQLENLLQLLGLAGKTFELANQYCSIMFLGIPLWFVSEGAVGHFFGRGKMVVLMAVVVSANLLNAILDPLLILGVGPFPALGIGGAAIASLSAVLMSGLTYIFVLFYRGHVRFIHLCFRWQGWRKLLYIGLPAAGREVGRPLSNLVLFRVVACFGPATVAALGIAMRYAGVMGIYIGALAVTLSSLAGRNIGAGKEENVEPLLIRGLQIGLIVHLLQAVMMTIFASTFLSLFDGSGEVVAAGANLLRIFAWSSTFVLCTHVMNAAFKGAGETGPIFLSSFFANWIVQVPMACVAAWVLVNPLGVWAALGLGHACEAVAAGSFYSTYSWRQSLDESAQEVG